MGPGNPRCCAPPLTMGVGVGGRCAAGWVGCGVRMTYCLGIVTKSGLVMASDSRTNAGYDQVNIVRKMHTFVQPGQRAFCVLSSGSLSVAQSVLNLLRREFEQGRGLADVTTMYDAARVIGHTVRAVAAMDREALEKDGFKCN